LGGKGVTKAALNHGAIGKGSIISKAGKHKSGGGQSRKDRKPEIRRVRWEKSSPSRSEKRRRIIRSRADNNPYDAVDQKKQLRYSFEEAKVGGIFGTATNQLMTWSPEKGGEKRRSVQTQVQER